MKMLAKAAKYNPKTSGIGSLKLAKSGG